MGPYSGFRTSSQNCVRRGGCSEWLRPRRPSRARWYTALVSLVKSCAYRLVGPLRGAGLDYTVLSLYIVALLSLYIVALLSLGIHVLLLYGALAIHRCCGYA